MFLFRIFVFSILISFEISKVNSSKDLNNLPIAINTWAFTNATKTAWELLIDNNTSTLDALVEGCSVCEREQCDGTVGYGGSPDENGETTLDAMIIDGSNMNMGAVANLREVKHAIKVARHVLENTQHSLLAGELATEFALEMGFKRESLSTEKSTSLWQQWKSKNCQPNFWENVFPDPRKSCGSYQPIKAHSEKQKRVPDNDNIRVFGKYNHDTISMIVIDTKGHIFAGTSTNGAIHKIPGRVGDSPIPGAGAYANNEFGAAGATGDGDIMMRFLPSFAAVQHLKDGYSPQEAAQKSIQSILRYYPHFVGAIIVVNKYGEYSAACSGMDKFPFSVRTLNHLDVTVEYVDCKI